MLRCSVVLLLRRFIAPLRCCVSVSFRDGGVVGGCGGEQAPEGLAATTHQQLRVPHGVEHPGRSQLQRPLPVPRAAVGERATQLFGRHVGVQYLES